MANNPKVLEVGKETPTEYVSGGQGTSSAIVSSAPKGLSKSQDSQVGENLTNVKGVATGNTEERSLKVSKDVKGGSYVTDTNQPSDPGRVKRNVVNTVTVEDVKALIKKYGGGDSYTKEQIDEMLATIREGQYVKVDTTEYPTLDDFLASEGEQGTVYLYPVGNEENNYYQYIWEVSEWVSLGTTALDLSNMVTTDTEQTITGVKTLAFTVEPDTTNIRDLGSATYAWKNIYANKTIYLGDVNTANQGSVRFVNPEQTNQGDWYIDSQSQSQGLRIAQIGQTGIVIKRPTVIPITNNYWSLGESASKWKDLYLSGIIDFGDGATIDKDSSNRLNLKYSNNTKIKIGGSNTIISNRIDPDNDNSQDIGRRTQRWKDFYLSGNLSDGTNSVNIADLKALIDYAKAQGWIS